MADTMRIKALNVGEVKRVSEGETKALKTFDEYTGQPLRVLGVPYGGHLNGRDSDGETFHEGTDTWLKAGDTIPVTYYHGYGPDNPQDWQDRPAVIGRAMYTHKDERGHWFDLRLDADEPLAKRILGNPAGAKASSGAIGHLVRTTAEGMIDVWPLGELAVFDTNEWRKPANELAVIEGVKSLTEDSAKAETRPESVDEVNEPSTETTIKENEMDEEIKEVKDEKPDLSELMEEIKSLKAMWNEAPITKKAVAVVHAENLGDPDPKAAFTRYLLTGEKTKGLKAAMGETTAGLGGYLVPDDFYSGIIQKRNELSIPRRAGAMVLQTSRDVLKIPVEATSQTYFSVSAEQAAVNEDEPTVGEVSVSVHNWTKLVKVSEQLLADNDANLDSFLSDSFGRWMAMTENKYTVSTAGTGTNLPQSVLVGGTAGLTFDDSDAIAASEIPELYYKLGSLYTDSAVWVTRNSTIGYLRGLASSSVFTFGGHDINGTQMMGKNYFTTDYVDAIAASKKVLVIGDWSRYALVERKGLSVRRLNELYAGTGQVGILATARWGGAVLQAEAFQYATTHS